MSSMKIAKNMATGLLLDELRILVLKKQDTADPFNTRITRTKPIFNYG